MTAITSIISAVTGHFTRALVFGALVPAAVFLGAAAPIVWPIASGIPTLAAAPGVPSAVFDE